MKPTTISLNLSLLGAGTPEQPGSNEKLRVGQGGIARVFDPATHVIYHKRLRMYGINEAVLHFDTGAFSGFDAYVAAVAQVETATAAGTISASGNAEVVISSDLLGSPVTLNVPVLSGDTATVWAGKVRTAIAANTTITNLYTVGGSGTSISLTRRIDDLGDVNDTVLNISLDNGTCTGITTAATSANTTAGAQATGSILESEDSVDAEGQPLPQMTTISALLMQGVRGSMDIVDGYSQLHGVIGARDLFLITNGGSILNSDITFTNADPSVAEAQITIVAYKS